MLTTVLSYSQLECIFRQPEPVQQAQAQNNADIFKKINAILDNTLDLSSIASLNVQPEQPKSKVFGICKPQMYMHM